MLIPQKKEVGDPHFLLLENNQQVTVKLSANFKNSWELIQSHLKILLGFA